MEEVEIENKFEKIKDELKYYVYKLIDPRDGKVFYVGKGFGNRVFDHVNCVKNNKVNEFIKEKKKDIPSEKNNELQIDIKSEKIERIKEILNMGLQVEYVIHRHGLNSEEAFLVEASLIDEIEGLSNIQGGHHSREYGPMCVQQLINKYSKEKIKQFDKNDKFIIIKVHSDTYNLDELYENSRKWWVVSKKRAKEAEKALIVVDGVVKLIINLDGNLEEMPGYDVEYKGKKRYAFSGEYETEESKYYDKLIPNDYRKKYSANPIQYTF